jgi:Flp pilus assembly pilin Flp
VISDAVSSTLVRAYLALKREEGQTFVEYALIGLLVAVALAAVLTTFATDISGTFTKIEAKL